MKDAKKSARKRDFLSKQGGGPIEYFLLLAYFTSGRVGQLGWMDGWVGVVKAFAAVAVPSCIRQWPEQLLQAVNGLIEVENLD